MSMYKIIGVVCLVTMAFSCSLSGSIPGDNGNDGGDGNGDGNGGGNGGVYVYPEQGQISFALGEEHSIMKTKSGELYGWGNNDNGQVGSGSSVSPVAMKEKIAQSADNSALPSIVAVAAGYSHNIAITISGELYTWGDGTHGKLGTGSTGKQLRPILIETFHDSQGVAISETLQFANVSGGWNHSLAVTTDGQLFSWGQRAKGVLGDGKSSGNDVLYPTQITQYKNSQGAMMPLPAISQVFAGADFSIALSEEQELLVWGEASYNQLGLGDRSDRSFPEKLLNFYDNNDVLISSHPKIKSLATGWRHSLAISTSGELFTWGENSSGQIGTASSKDAPRKLGEYVDGNSQVMSIPAIMMNTAGREFSVTLTESGKILTWGTGSNGELGQGTRTDTTLPFVVGLYEAAGGGTPENLPRITKIYAGEYHVFAYAENGKLFAWGSNAKSQLGIPGTSNVTRPRDVSSLLP